MAGTHSTTSLAWLLMAALVLAGCAGSRELELEGDSRDIAMVVDAASAEAGAPAITQAQISRVSPSFVTLVISKPRQGPGFGATKGVASGSGFFVSRDGVVMTAGHVAVATGMRASAVASDDRVHDGSVIAVSQVPDVALVSLPRLRAQPVVPAASPCLKRGEPVFSLGRPRNSGFTARIGEVVSMHFGQPVRYGRFGYDDAMVLRLNTRRGESGGPLFNARGELVGMIVSTLSRGGRSLHLAHAIALPDLARFYCARQACSGRWRQLATMSTRNCPVERRSAAR